VEYYEWKVILKTNLNGRKIPKKIINQGIELRTYILASDRCTSKPTVHPVEGLQSTNISCTMLAYIYSAHAPCVIARLLVTTGFSRAPVRRFFVYARHGICTVWSFHKVNRRSYSQKRFRHFYVRDLDLSHFKTKNVMGGGNRWVVVQHFSLNLN